MLRDLINIRAAIIIVLGLASAACSGSGGQFSGWQTEEFGETRITENTSKSFALGNASGEEEQHVRALAFDRGSNSAGHFRIDGVAVGNQVVEPTDIVIPPGSSMNVTVIYSPLNLETTKANYGGWVTGEDERWVPMRPDEVDEWGKRKGDAIHRAIVLAVYDYPREGIMYVHLVGRAVPGPSGEEESGGAFAACTPGGGVACYTGGFAVDIPELAPGGPKTLELTGPIRLGISGGAASLRMDDFPLAIMYLRSEEIPQLPSGVTATLVISGAPGVEAEGSFDGSRLTLAGVAFRIRVALGELSADQVRQGISALVDFEIPDLEITTIRPLTQGEITLHMETSIPENPSGNELFDQFLSGASVIAIMEGELAF